MIAVIFPGFCIGNFLMQFFQKCHSKKSMKAKNNPVLVLINPFNATTFFLYPLETSENLWFSDVSRGYRKKAVA